MDPIERLVHDVRQKINLKQLTKLDPELASNLEEIINNIERRGESDIRMRTQMQIAVEGLKNEYESMLLQQNKLIGRLHSSSDIIKKLKSELDTGVFDPSFNPGLVDSQEPKSKVRENFNNKLVHHLKNLESSTRELSDST